MSVADRLLAGKTVEVRDLEKALVRAMFGDRLGATLALFTLVWIGVTWRLGFFSNDQYTFANTVLGLADGQLHITQPRYGPSSGATPGTYLVEGRVYGRNYGVVLVATVWYVLLKLLSLVLDVRVLLTGLWALGFAALAAEVGRRVERPRAGLYAGTATAGVLFGTAVLAADPLSWWWIPLLALQLTTALATAATVTVVYRLLRRLYDRRVGTLGALATVLATPVGFWATLPKRHNVTALLLVCTMYTLYRSQTARTARTATRFRALSYVWPALLAWVHAPHGFILLVAIALVDLPTARSNGVRDLLAVGGTFALALLPFLLTNTLLSGNPLVPPRFLPGYSGDVLGPGAFENRVGSANSGGTAGSGGPDRLLPAPIARIVGQFTGSYAILLDPARLFRIFVRTGYIPSFRSTEDAAINLSVLASMPLLGGLVAYPALALRRARTRRDWLRSPRCWAPVRVVDAFTVGYAVLLLGLYLKQLPVNHMLTVRYLHPLYPLGIYWLIRLPALRRTVDTAMPTLAYSYGVTLLVGLPAYLAAIAAGQLFLPESVQLYALLALSAAAGVAAWAGAATVRERYARVGAVALGVAAGVMSVYLLVAGLSLFPVTGEFLLPLSRLVSERIHYVRLLGSSPF